MAAIAWPGIRSIGKWLPLAEPLTGGAFSWQVLGLIIEVLASSLQVAC